MESWQSGSVAWVELVVRGVASAGVWFCGGPPPKFTQPDGAGAMSNVRSFELRAPACLAGVGPGRQSLSRGAILSISPHFIAI